MIISHRKRFIFIHIYKVAGTSVRDAFSPYADITFRKYTLRRLLYVMRLAKAPEEHITTLELSARLPSSIFDSYFKFAFVRNPWDWQVSLYHYILSHPLHPQHRKIKALGSFRSYINWRIKSGVELQKSFVCDKDGRLLVDFVGRYETIAEDFEVICDRIGISASLPHKNPSNHRPYRNYYDAELARMVAEHYREDIEYFNYKY